MYIYKDIYLHIDVHNVVLKVIQAPRAVAVADDVIGLFGLGLQGVPENRDAGKVRARATLE